VYSNRINVVAGARVYCTLCFLIFSHLYQDDHSSMFKGAKFESLWMYNMTYEHHEQVGRP
jgi:hypothetical protein